MKRIQRTVALLAALALAPAAAQSSDAETPATAAPDAVVDEIVEVGRLHQQATGAVFAIPCTQSFFGSDYHRWPEQPAGGEKARAGGNLAVIHCIVGHRLSNGIAFDDTWHHIAWVDRDGDASLYLDGARDATDCS